MTKTIAGHPPVICHGDLWNNNCIFDNNANQLLAIIDWQWAHQGCVVEDLSFLLSVTLPPKVSTLDARIIIVDQTRRDNTTQILTYYHHQLSMQCTSHRIQCPLTLEDIHTAYTHFLPNTLAWNIIETGFDIGENSDEILMCDTMCDKTFALLEDVVELKERGMIAGMM